MAQLDMVHENLVPYEFLSKMNDISRLKVIQEIALEKGFVHYVQAI